MGNGHTGIVYNALHTFFFPLQNANLRGQNDVVVYRCLSIAITLHPSDCGRIYCPGIIPSTTWSDAAHTSSTEKKNVELNATIQVVPAHPCVEKQCFQKARYRPTTVPPHGYLILFQPIIHVRTLLGGRGKRANPLLTPAM